MSSSSSNRSGMTAEEGDAVSVNVIPLPGFRFYPTDESLVSYYLRKKIEGTDSRFRHFIREIDVSKYDPGDLPEFFFSRPDYKYANSTRCNRATDEGFYKITGKEREIKAERSKAVIGMKRTLTFYLGRVANATKTDWILHEYYLTETEVGSKPTKRMDFVICRLKNKSAGYKEPKVDSIRGELADSGANFEEDRDAVSDVIAEPVEHLGSKEPGDVNRSESPDGSCPMDCNGILTVDGDDETGGWKFNDSDDPVASDMVRELCAEGEVPNSPSQPLQPPQTPQTYQTLPPYQPQDYCPSTLQPLQSPQPHQPQDYCPYTLQQPLHTRHGIDPNVYGDCTKRQSLIPDNSSSPEYKNSISTNDRYEQVSKLANGVQDRATDERISEAFFNPEELMGPFGYLLMSPMNTDLGEFVLSSKYIGCIDELPSLEDTEIAAFFP
ncbi:NAC domain-containing protein 68-like [Pyrus x bretschneideri]|uniref:NAC domain-containing protein 68-like n=1 Tax=Pyrus x bretschneideri TaxID=225117 RepID=UPI00202E40FA|nr:NAC domain-containing protein 68-like [Pyrus x bretschneideri]